MKILGYHVLVSKIEEEQKEGFATVDVQDSFVNKGKVEQVGEQLSFVIHSPNELEIKEGAVVLFAKYSPDTHEIEHEGKKMKIVRVEDILAVL